MILKPILAGLLAMLVLLGIYFTILTLISGWQFAFLQFSSFWYFIVSLALGFGIQVGFYSYLRQVIRQGQNEVGPPVGEAGKVVAVSGTTSTIAMISCCSHYLVNILPIMGIAGFLTLVSQYQIQLFWLGLLANLMGIIFILSRIMKL